MNKIDMVDFEKSVEEHLGGLNQKQLVFFAWLCGVRALPLLGAAGASIFQTGNFNLYNIFYALDVTAYIASVEGVADYNIAKSTADIAIKSALIASVEEEVAYTVAKSACATAYAAYAATMLEIPPLRCVRFCHQVCLRRYRCRFRFRKLWGGYK